VEGVCWSSVHIAPRYGFIRFLWHEVVWYVCCVVQQGSGIIGAAGLVAVIHEACQLPSCSRAVQAGKQAVTGAVVCACALLPLQTVACCGLCWWSAPTEDTGSGGWHAAESNATQSISIRQLCKRSAEGRVYPCCEWVALGAWVSCLLPGGAGVLGVLLKAHLYIRLQRGAHNSLTGVLTAPCSTAVCWCGLVVSLSKPDPSNL
jgi:hypothetical protein